MHKRLITEKIRQRTANIGDGNPGMFQAGYNRRPQEGPMGHMQPGVQPPVCNVWLLID